MILQKDHYQNTFLKIYDNYYTNEFPQIEEYNPNIFDFTTDFVKKQDKIKQKKISFYYGVIIRSE